MKPITAFILLTVLALVAGPVTCVSGLDGHCPTAPHDHDEDGHEATPHAPCLGDPVPPVKKAPVIERSAVCGPDTPAVDADAGPETGETAFPAAGRAIEPPACRRSLPLLS